MPAMVGSLPSLPPQRVAFSLGRSEPLQATHGHDVHSSAPA